MPYYQLERIISGGQTGIDQLGLEIARSLSIPTGGVAPKGYMTEEGPNSQLKDDYGLSEHTSASYPPRTKSNVQQSDGTVLFGELTGGTKLTLDACQRESKPYIVNPTAEQLRAWLTEHQIKVLNIAGSKESRLPYEKKLIYHDVLTEALGAYRSLQILFDARPGQWGLRGDQFLWQDLALISRTLQLPASERDLTDLLLMLIKNLTGEELAVDKVIHVPRYRYGGMSSGMVSADFWLDKAIPLLKKRLGQLQ